MSDDPESNGYGALVTGTREMAQRWLRGHRFIILAWLDSQIDRATFPD